MHRLFGEYMLDIRKNIAASLVLMLFAMASAHAADTASEVHQRIGTGDPVLGKEKSAYCQGCHGEVGMSVSPIFPNLAGQWADYIQKQFRNFQSHSRINETMNQVALTIDDFENLYDIAAYFASQKQMDFKLPEPTGKGPDKQLYLAGQKLYYDGDPANGVFRCVMCHGERGRGEPLNNNLFPVLGGQHKDYIVKQLRDFKSGFRLNDHSGMMPRITSNMTLEQMEALGHYLSRTSISPDPNPIIPAPGTLPDFYSSPASASATK
jgi:cytochrome c553